MKSLIFAAMAVLATPVIAMADPAYLIAQIHVDDWESFMDEYGTAVAPTLMEHGARVMIAGPGAEVLEGEWPGNHTVVVEFESMEKAKAWYTSAEYAEALPLRHKNTSLNNLVFAPAFVPFDQ